MHASTRRLFAALAFLVCAAPAGADAGPVNGRYTISLAGIPIGTGTITGDVAGDRYALTVSAALTGVAAVVTKGQGAAQASGVLPPGKGAVSTGYALTASNGEMTRTIQVAMGKGDVAGVKIDPPFEDRPDRLPVLDSHKKGVLDPVSALVLPMASDNPLAPENCNRTLPIFDGSQRFDVMLSYGGVKPAKATGFKGQVLVCHVRFHAISGHRPEREAVKFMDANKDIETWLVKVDGAKVLIPFKVSIKTMVGTSVFEARSLQGVYSDLVN